MTTNLQIKKRGRKKLELWEKKPRKKYYVKKDPSIPHGNTGKKNPRAGRKFSLFSDSRYQVVNINSRNTINFIQEATKLKISQAELFEKMWATYTIQSFIRK